jgi:hypothetical protein
MNTARHVFMMARVQTGCGYKNYATPKPKLHTSPAVSGWDGFTAAGFMAALHVGAQVTRYGDKRFLWKTGENVI